MTGVFVLVSIIMVGIFVTDWFFIEQDGERLMTETLVGILIGTPLGWVGAYVAYYTTENQNKEDTAKLDEGK
jgi:NhaP-type Na+/H+ or K+/H+ antiporter